jgi:UDP-glucose 4-epimerase
MSVFGKIISLPIDENHPKIPETIYGISKLLGEIFCREYSKLYGINTIILRYSSVYGPGMDNKWVIPTFIRCALEGKPLCITDNISGDFIYVKDVININVLVACNELISNEDFNVGTGKETYIEELAYTIKIFFPDVKICYLKDKKLTKRFVFNISKLKSMLRYTPKYSLIDGLKELIEYIKREAYKK